MTVVELPLTVFVVDDEPPARNRIKELLGDCSEQLPLEIVGEAGNGREALAKLSEVMPTWYWWIFACRRWTVSNWRSISTNCPSRRS